jgi:hypothetical protein
MIDIFDHVQNFASNPDAFYVLCTAERTIGIVSDALDWAGCTHHEPPQTLEEFCSYMGMELERHIGIVAGDYLDSTDISYAKHLAAYIAEMKCYGVIPAKWDTIMARTLRDE